MEKIQKEFYTFKIEVLMTALRGKVTGTMYFLYAYYSPYSYVYKENFLSLAKQLNAKETTIKAKDKNEALSKFWHGKNPESWEVTSVVLLKD